MPHTKSAKKNLRKSLKRRMRNKNYMRSIRELTKKYEKSLTGGTTEQLQADFVAAIKKLDKAAARRVIHPNTAARKKSQLARQLNEKKKAAAATPATPPQS